MYSMFEKTCTNVTRYNRGMKTGNKNERWQKFATKGRVKSENQKLCDVVYVFM